MGHPVDDVERARNMSQRVAQMWDTLQRTIDEKGIREQCVKWAILKLYLDITVFCIHRLIGIRLHTTDCLSRPSPARAR